MLIMFTLVYKSSFNLPEEHSCCSCKNTGYTKEMPITGSVRRNIRMVVGSVHVTCKSKDEDKNNNKLD